MYPEEGRKKIGAKTDQFANPMKHTYLGAIDKLISYLAGSEEFKDHEVYLAEMIQVTAIQAMAPSEALAFIPKFKITARELFKDLEASEFTKLDAQLDALLLDAINVYVRCRERLYEVKLAELKRNNYMIMRQSGILKEHPA